MKKAFQIIFTLLMSTVIFSSCSTHNVPEGHNGLVIVRPYLFGSSHTEVVPPGRVYYAWTSSVVDINVQQFKMEENFADLNTHNNVPVDVKIYYTFVIDPQKIDVLYSKFGLDWYEKSIRQELCNLTRDKCSTYEMNPLTNDPKVSQEISDFVRIEGNKIIQSLGIPVLLRAVNLGKRNPPEEVIAERSRTAAAVQKQKTIDQETQNQISRQSSETERAKADRAYQNALGLSTQQYILLQDIDVRRIAANKASQVTIIENGNNVSLTRDIK